MAQKSLLLLTLMVVAIISGCASSPTRVEVARAAMGRQEKAVSAPAPTATFTPVGCKGGPKYFDSAKDCENAMQSGECSYYSPSYTGGKGRNPVDGTSKVRVPLEKEACVKMHVVGAISWVPQKEGDLLRFRKKMDGTLEEVPYARDDCGNEVLGIVYPQPKKVVASPPVPPAQARQERNVCAENGLYDEQYSPGFTRQGEPTCIETIPWYETTGGKVVIIVVGGAIIAGACKIITNRWSCGVIKHHHTSTGTPVNPGGYTGPTNPGGY